MKVLHSRTMSYLIGQKFEFDHELIYEANFLWAYLDKNKVVTICDFENGSYELSNVVFENGEKYKIILLPVDLEKVNKELINLKDSGFDNVYDLMMFQKRNIDFSDSNCQIKIISEKNPFEIQYVFSNYSEAIEYLEQVESGILVL